MSDWWWYLLVIVVVVLAGLLLFRLQRQRGQAQRTTPMDVGGGERDYAGDRERVRSEGMSADDRAWELASQQREQERSARRQGETPPDRPS